MARLSADFGVSILIQRCKYPYFRYRCTLVILAGWLWLLEEHFINSQQIYFNAQSKIVQGQPISICSCANIVLLLKQFCSLVVFIPEESNLIPSQPSFCKVKQVTPFHLSLVRFSIPSVTPVAFTALKKTSFCSFYCMSLTRVVTIPGDSTPRPSTISLLLGCLFGIVLVGTFQRYICLFSLFSWIYGNL